MSCLSLAGTAPYMKCVQEVIECVFSTVSQVLVVDPILVCLYTPRAFSKGSVLFLRLIMRSLLIIQLVIVLLGVVVSVQYFGQQAMLPAFYGGAVALANTMLLSGRIKKFDELAKTSPQTGVMSLMLGVLQRFVFVLVALGVGLGALKLLPLPLLGTFMAAQLAYVIGSMRQ